MEFWPIEGNRLKLDGGAMFGNCPKLLWQLWEKPDESNRIELAARSLLVKTDGGELILFEAGVGDVMEDKLKQRYGVPLKGHRLLDSLHDIDVDEGQIDAVVLSHLHFDHAGGLLAYDQGELKLLFSNARYYISKSHFEYAMRPPDREKASFLPALHDLLIQSGKMVLLDGYSCADLGDKIHFSYSDGHTVGMVISSISTGKGDLIFCSDLIPGRSWVHLPVTMGYDRYPALKAQEKQILYEELLSKKSLLFFTHDPHIALAEIAKEDGRYLAKEISF